MISKDEHWIIDVGNTRTKLVMFSGDEITSVLTDEAAIAFAENALNSGELPDQCMLAASGQVSHDWEEWIAQANKTLPKGQHAFTLNDANDAGVLSHYESMATLGLDRAANARAALAENPESNWLVIDAGTCLTVDWIEKGTFTGGSIAPGIELRLRAMYAGTANLPFPEDWRDRANLGIGLHIGQNTIDALLAGAIGGANSELQARIEAFSKEYDEFCVAVTGGDADCLELRTRCTIFADPNLTWKGYHLILKDLVQKN